MTGLSESSTSLPKIRIIRRPEVSRLTGLGKSALYQRMEQGHFPRCIKIGERTVGWVESEVLSWIQEQVDRRDEGKAGP